MRHVAVAIALVMASCSSDDTAPPNTGILEGTWQIQQPSQWTDFRFTLTEATCNVAFNDPCSYTVIGQAATTPLLCQVAGMTALSMNGAGYICSTGYPLTGKAVGDDVTVRFAAYKDGATVDLTARLAADRSNLLGDLNFTDPTGVVHHIGGPCTTTSEPVCLDGPGQVTFVRGGTAVADVTR
jgi:hypothetical protein